MLRRKLVAACAVATVALAAAPSAASAFTVWPAGSITASFPVGGLTISTPVSTTSCSIEFTGSIASNGFGSITTATVFPSPCNGITYSFAFPWSGWIGLPFSGLVPMWFTFADIEANIAGIRCRFSGRLSLDFENGGTSAWGNDVLPPRGTLTGACGTMVIGGTGGSLRPLQVVY